MITQYKYTLLRNALKVDDKQSKKTLKTLCVHFSLDEDMLPDSIQDVVIKQSTLPQLISWTRLMPSATRSVNNKAKSIITNKVAPVVIT